MSRKRKRDPNLLEKIGTTIKATASYSLSSGVKAARLASTFFAPELTPTFLQAENAIKRDQVKRAWRHSVTANDLRPGDHIYTWRKGGIYAHHGIYIGNDQVIHFLPTEAATQLGEHALRGVRAYLDNQLPTFIDEGIGALQNLSQQLARIQQTDIETFLHGGDLCRVKYGDDGKIGLYKKRSGTYQAEPSAPAEHVISRAQYLLQYADWCNYNLLNFNCEHFATLCKLGHAKSGQIEAFFNNLGALTSHTMN